MNLVSMKAMLVKAKDEKYAVGQFNINNLEWTKSILSACEEMNSPVILGVSEGATRYMGGFKTVVGKMCIRDRVINTPTVLKPIAVYGDLIGAVIVVGENAVGELEKSIAEMTSLFIGKYLES